MRILSQNGVDIPYDLYGFRQLSSDLSKIIAFQNSDEYLVMAKYSSAAKAEKAMEMLRFCYKEHVTEMIYHEGSGYIHPHFQFPAENEIEV